MPHPFRDRPDNARGAGWFHLFWDPLSFGSKSSAFRPDSARNRQLGLGIEEMQAASLRRQADLIAARDDGFRRHASSGDAGAADPRLQQDLGAKLLDDLDPGIETKARPGI